jgi:replicative DNA helicase
MNKEDISPETSWFKAANPDAPIPKQSATVMVMKLIEQLEKEEKRTSAEVQNLESIKRLKEVALRYEGEDRVVSTKEIALAMKSRPPEAVYKVGLKGLDDILGGFRMKQLITLAAPTKAGKTSFAVELTIRLKDFHPLWFPFEEPAEELIQKFLDRNEEPPEFYVPEVMTGDTLLWIEKKIVESIAKYNSQFVVIDHLHFIVPFSSERQDLRIGETMRALKGLAKKWGVTIILIAHLKKTKVVEQPTLEDLRDSSFIAQESDTVIFLWRETTKENGEVIVSNNTNLSVQANRRTGKTGNIKLVYENGRFLEKDWTHEDKELNSFAKSFKDND